MTTGADADTTDETFTLTASNTGGTALNGSTGDASTKTVEGTIWATSTNDVALSGATTVSENAGTVTITATSTNPQPHDVIVPLKTADVGTSSHGAGGDYTNYMARSSGGDFRDYTALATDAVITIPANQTTGSTTVSINDDAADETATQYFKVAADTGGTRAVLGGAMVSGQDSVEIGITDNDATPTLSIADSASATEGARLLFPVSLSGASEKDTTFTFATSDTPAGSIPAATGAGDTSADYQTVNGTKTIPQYSKLINIPVSTYANPTTTWEGPENVKATISGASANVTLGTKTTANGTITDAEAGKTIQYSTADTFNNSTRSWTEGNSGWVDKKIYVKFLASSTYPATLNYTFTDDTATNGTDYIGKAGSITLPASSTDPIAIPVSINGDRVAEANETFKLSVTSTSGVADPATLGDITFTINDDPDAAPTWTTEDVKVQEGNSGTTVARVPVKLNAPAPADATFTAVITPGTAVDATSTTGTNDYDPPATGSATVNAGSTVGYLEVPINGDEIYERDETFTIAFTSPGSTYATTDPDNTVDTAKVTIGNDDAQPKFTFSQSSVTEGGTVGVAGTVVGVSQYTYHIGFTVGGGATNPATTGTDFTVPATLAATDIEVRAGESGLITAAGKFAAMPGGYTSLPVVSVLDDTIDEPTENITITANEISTNLTGFATSSVNVKVIDDPLDLPPAVSIADVSVNESAGTAEVPVDLTFTGEATSTTQDVTIPYYTADGSAKAGQDYKLTKGTLTVPPGTMKTSIKIPLIDDHMMEGDEAFSVRVGSPGPLGASVISGDSTVTIKNDDKSNPVTPTLSASGPAKGAGAITLTGKAAPNTAVEIWASALPATDPAKMALWQQVKSDGSGSFKFTTKSLDQGYAFVARSEDINSAVRTVKLTQSPALTLGTTKGKLSVTVYGNPKAAGQTVTVQRLVGKKWTTIASGKTTSTGFRKSVSIKSKTKVSVRALVSGNSSTGIASGYSATKTITIK
ncbi:Calx-beta domain-containing protein [Actinoplanes oblitus]|uniref:Calx-beta domain-containing protein n=1 Tax=Actinoplanes oblitus TaxID=3040509 RepID=A0ABY8WBE3_9ACTN|nr:Calx-beta domain-containing protein [Actinoplanes oblitus]WIM95110.1 Calx-beta domain-containing protein [Actinoplanes oblitus]